MEKRRFIFVYSDILTRFKWIFFLIFCFICAGVSCSSDKAGDTYKTITESPDILQIRAGASSEKHKQFINTVQIRWEPVENAVAYHVYRSGSLDGTYNRITPEQGMTGDHFLDSGLEHYRCYFYKIRVTLQSGELSAFSMPFTGTAASEAVGTDGARFVRYTAVDEIRSNYDEHNNEYTLFDVPAGVAYDASRDVLYVTDENVGRLTRFSLLQQTAAFYGKGTLNTPGDITLDDEGNVYIADTYNHRIVKLDKDLEEVVSWGTLGSGYSETGEFNKPTGIAVYKNRYVFVVDSLNFRIQVFCCVGDRVHNMGWFGRAGTRAYGTWQDGGSVNAVLDGPGEPGQDDGAFGGAEGLHGPTGIAVDKLGNVYVADTENHRVQKLSFKPLTIATNNISLNSGNMTFLGWWGWDGYYEDDDLMYGHTGWHGPGSGKYGNMPYIDDIQESRCNGAFMLPRYAAIDSSGYVYVSDYYLSGGYLSRVQKFTNTGEYVTHFGKYGSFDLESLAACSGISIKDDSLVYVGDKQNSRIAVFEKEELVNDQLPQQEVIALGVCTQMSALENANLVVTWTAVDGAKTYEVYRAEHVDGPFAVITPEGGTTSRSFVDHTAVHYRKYYYKVRAQTGAGQYSYFSSTVESEPGLDRNSYAYDSDIELYHESLPFGLAFVYGQDRLAVTDSNLHSLSVFNSSGIWLNGLLTDPQDESDDYTYFRKPRGVAVDGAGNMYIADTDNNRICKTDKNLETVINWDHFGGGGFVFDKPSAVAVYGDCLLIVDSGSCRVVVVRVVNDVLEPVGWYGCSSVSGSGTWHTDFAAGPVAGSGDGAFGFNNTNGMGPSDIAVDPLGAVYVTDTCNHRIQKFIFEVPENSQAKPYLQFAGWWGFDGIQCGWHGPGSGKTGVFPDNVLALSDGQLVYPRGIAADRNGYVYVSDYYETSLARVVKFSGTGEYLTGFGMYGSAGRSYLRSCNGLAVDDSGAVYVSDTANHRIAKFIR